MRLSSVTFAVACAIAATASVVKRDQFPTATDIRYGSRFAMFFADEISTNSIVQLDTKLVLPKLPTPQLTRLILGPSVVNKRVSGTESEYNFLQVAIVSTESYAYECHDLDITGKWCVFATKQTEHLDDPWSFRGHQGPAAVAPGETLQISFNHTGPGSVTTHSVSIGDNVISNYTWPTGPAYLFDIDVVTENNAIATSPAHNYTDTTIVLAKPDPDFYHKVNLTLHGVELRIPYSIDDGKTWTFPWIYIHESETWATNYTGPEPGFLVPSF